MKRKRNTPVQDAPNPIIRRESSIMEWKRLRSAKERNISFLDISFSLDSAIISPPPYASPRVIPIMVSGITFGLIPKNFITGESKRFISSITLILSKKSRVRINNKTIAPIVIYFCISANAQFPKDKSSVVIIGSITGSPWYTPNNEYEKLRIIANIYPPKNRIRNIGRNLAPAF